MDAQASVIVELLAQILDEYGPEIFKDEEELCQVIEEVFSDAELEEAKELLLVVAESGALRYVGDFQLPDLEIPDSYEVGRHKALLVLMQKEEMPEELAEFVLELVDEALGLGDADVDFLEELEEAAEGGEEEEPRCWTKTTTATSSFSTSKTRRWSLSRSLWFPSTEGFTRSCAPWIGRRRWPTTKLWCL